MIVSKAVLLTAMGLAFCFPVHGQTVHIRVQFLNGNSGQALKNTRVVVYDNSDPTHRKYLRTDANGTVQTTAERGSWVRAFVHKGFFRSCEDGTIASIRRFDVDEIMSSGIVEESHCRASGPAAESGLLVRVVRKSTFLEALQEN